MNTLITILLGISVISLLVLAGVTLRSRLRAYRDDESSVDPAVSRTQSLRWLLVLVILVCAVLGLYAITR